MPPISQIPGLSRLTLGTVQLGLEYGIANARGRPDAATAQAILTAAYARGITAFDTARAYGDAEAVIGRWLRECGRSAAPLIVTKVKSMSRIPRADIRAAVHQSLADSRAALGRASLDLVLVHRGEDLLEDEVYEALQAEKREGKLGRLGASVYDPQVTLQLLAHRDIDALQIPSSVVDQRFAESEVQDRASARNVLIFARSAFLQGALLMAPEDLPPHLTGLQAPLQNLRTLALACETTPSSLLLRFSIQEPGVASVVVGVESCDQLAAHLASMESPPLDQALREALRQSFAGLPANVIDPSKWPR